LAGALLYTQTSSRALTIVLGLLLLATSLATLTNWSERWSPRGSLVGVLGFSSGLFGGVAGNQGGLRAAALMSFNLPPVSYVATATGIALLVDAARTPVYLWRAGSELASLWLPLTIATGGVLVGTVLGERILLGLSRHAFRTIVGGLIGLLGLSIIIGAV
jgi:uncharacterized membrane protein YfcA